jgi:glucose-6-phosphate isomerase
MTTSPSRSSQRKIEDLASYATLHRETLFRFDEKDAIARMWTRDAALWKEDAKHQEIIKNSLGWLNIAVPMRRKADDLVAWVDEIRAAGFVDVCLLGMGGSSLCPEVFRRVFGSRKGFPRLHVLDSTVPATVLKFDRALDPSTTLFIVASKSGSTIEPQSFYRYFWERVKSVKGDRAGENFVAITDPGSMLEGQAKERNFRKIFPGSSDIGGRYSALSNFGIVPAALIGVDIKVLLDRALHSVNFCSQNTPTLGMPGARRGAFLGAMAKAGRDKLTFVIDPPLASLGLWIEQLVAESTGKEGIGVVPVCGEELGAPESYGEDRAFVYIQDRETNDPVIEAKLDALTAAGHPSIRIILNERINIGEELFLWEFATALAGVTLEINPFDQPNVQEAKTKSVALIDAYKASGRLPEETPVCIDGDLSFFARPGDFTGCADAAAVVSKHLASLKPSDYFAILQFVDENEASESLVQEMRMSVRDRFKVATTAGFGPRFLHSTGQLHKGGADNGVFLQITCDDAADADIPGEGYSFGVLKQAQAKGDIEALLAKGRRALRVHIKGPIETGLKRLAGLIRG